MVALFASIQFGVLYLWNTYPGFTRAAGDANCIWTVAGVGCGFVMASAAWMLRKGGHFLFDLVVALLSAGIMATLYLAIRPVLADQTALGATLWVMAGFVAVHLFVLIYWSLFIAARKILGHVGLGQCIPEINRVPYAVATASTVLVAGIVLPAPQLELFV